MDDDFIMESQSFYLSLYFWSLGAIFPLGRGKFCWVKFENAPGNGFEKYSLGRLNFSFGEDFVVPKFTYFALAWLINFSDSFICTSSGRLNTWP